MAVALAALLLPSQAVQATPAPDAAPVVVADGLSSPLQMDVDTRGRILVSQETRVSVVDTRGDVEDLVDVAPASVGGVAFGYRGSVIFTTSDFEAGEHLLRIRGPKGNVHTIADLGAYETRRNPDKVNNYGFRGLSDECKSQVPEEFLPYKGLVDSHPYALATTPFGVFVAEAGGNDVLFVDWFGHIRLISVLPPRPTVITADIAAGLGLPDCVAGKTFNFEPVPTDVEFTPRGKLLVSSLPGGPEDASLGARGAVFEVDPWGGRAHLVAKGFLGATNLAVSPDGTIYVAELFGGQVSKVDHGGAVPVETLPTPAALEWFHGKLLATTNVFAPGEGNIVRFAP